MIIVLWANSKRILECIEEWNVEIYSKRTWHDSLQEIMSIFATGEQVEWIEMKLHHVIWPIATCELCWDFLEEERMMQYGRDKYFPQLWNQGYQSSRRTKQHYVNSTCTQTTKYLQPNAQEGLPIPPRYWDRLNCIGFDK